MPDHRMPDRHIPDDLDRRIRDLVARAVADAPEPPDISGHDAVIEPTQLDRRRWWYGGGITVAAAAALIAVFVLSADDEETTRPTSATQPPAVHTVPTSPSAATTPASTDVSSRGTVSSRTSSPTTVGGVTPNVMVATTAPTTIEPPASGGVDGIVAAGPGGVVAYDNDLSRTIINDPMEMAIAIGDGNYLVQRKIGNMPGTEPADTEPLILSADGTLSPLWTDAEPRYHTVHDIEVVDGRRLVVYTVIADQPVNAESDLTAHIMVADLERPGAASTELGSVDTWEGGVSRLHLTTDGLVVGEMFAEASHSFVAYAVPGTPASDEPVPAAADLGLDDYYTDCNDCPNAFTVSPNGTNVAWLIRTPGVDGHTELVMHPMNGDAERPFDPFATDINTTLIDDVDLLAEGAILLSYWDGEGSEPRPPVFIANDGTTTVLSGIIATANPTGR